MRKEAVNPCLNDYVEDVWVMIYPHVNVNIGLGQKSAGDFCVSR